jgi:signal-transduction protein with cAMP-binding, CBS, and nucleotidyltransferase domain
MQLKAKDVVRQAITLEPNNTVYDARNVLLRYNISRVVIAKDNKPLGIVQRKIFSDSYPEKYQTDVFTKLEYLR